MEQTPKSCTHPIRHRFTQECLTCGQAPYAETPFVCGNDLGRCQEWCGQCKEMVPPPPATPEPVGAGEAVTPDELARYQALRDDVRRKLVGYEAADPHTRTIINFLRVPCLLDEADATARALTTSTEATALREQQVRNTRAAEAGERAGRFRAKVREALGKLLAECEPDPAPHMDTTLGRATREAVNHDRKLQAKLIHEAAASLGIDLNA